MKKYVHPLQKEGRLDGLGWGNKWFTYSKERKGDKKKRQFFLIKRKCLPIPKEKKFGKERKFAKGKQSVCG